MENLETVPLTCPKCRAVTVRPLRWVQENMLYSCAGCGASILINKDEVTKALALQARDSR